VSYKNLTPGKEYTVKGILMNKATGKPLVIDGEEIRASYTFKPETSDGGVTVTPSSSFVIVVLFVFEIDNSAGDQAAECNSAQPNPARRC